ncbi:STAS domain-containing protein [Streptomyces sp. NPDC060085]|uniref:STAS domain-containing protein n=1 Tax=Streptomyces sp. NPDC060085 TaxID=3347054 RepID=UPI003661855F
MNDPAGNTHHGLLVLHAPFRDAYVLTLRGIADGSTRASLADDFARAADTGLPLIVDLAALEFGDENLLGLLLDAYRGGGLTLVGPLSSSFARRLDIAGLLTLFTIHPTLAAALKP